MIGVQKLHSIILEKVEVAMVIEQLEVVWTDECSCTSSSRCPEGCWVIVDIIYCPINGATLSVTSCSRGITFSYCEQLTDLGLEFVEELQRKMAESIA